MKHQNMILVAIIGELGRYGNVTVAYMNVDKSTADGAVYDIPANTTPILPPHVAPDGKDWLYAPDTQDGWVLADDYADALVYDKRNGLLIAPPAFGQPLADNMTLVTPMYESGMVTYWDDDKQGWVRRKDWSGTQVWSTSDPLQSVILSISDTDIPRGYTDQQPPSAAFDWDAKKSVWVLNKDKQAEMDKQALDAADAQLTCLMSQMCAWLTIESYKPKTDQRGGNILSPVKIDEMLQGLPSSVETDLMRNAWSRATNIEFTNATTQSFAQMLGMSKDQLRAAMTEARGL